MVAFNKVALRCYATQAILTGLGYAMAIPVGAVILADKFFRRLKGDRDDPATALWMSVKLEDPVPGLHHSWLSVNGIRIHAVRADAETASPPKPVMLMLHGFPQAWFAWQNQIRHFRENFDVWAIDMRGYNESDKPEGVHEYTRAKLVSDVVEVIKQISPDRKVALVGHDWGAFVAWEVARAFPQYLSHLVAVCAPHPKMFLEKVNLSQVKRSYYMMFFQTRWVPEMVLSTRSFLVIEKMFYGSGGLRHRERISQQDIIRYKQAMARPGALTATINYYRALFGYDPRAHRIVPGKLKVPTLLLWAENDIAFVPETFRGVDAYVEDVRVISLPDCSHFAPEDCPQEVNAYVDRFLQDHAAALNAMTDERQN